MIMSESGWMIFIRSMLDTGASINILPKEVFDCHHVGKLQLFLIEWCFVNGLVRKPHDIVEDVIVRIGDRYFPIGFLVIDMKLIREPSQALIILRQPFLTTMKVITD